MYSILYNSQNSELMAIVIKVLSNVRHSSSLLKNLYLGPLRYKDTMKPVWYLYRRFSSGNFSKIFGIQN